MQLQHHATKSKRLEARVTPQVKSILQQAAELQGSSLSEFVSRSAEEVARQVIQQHNLLQLSAAESRAFADVLFGSTKPNPALKKAFTVYKKEVSSVR